MKRKRINKYRKSRFIIGSLFILIGTCLIIFDNYSNYKISKIEEQKVEEFFVEDIIEEIEEPVEVVEEKNKENKLINYNYVAVIEIPMINLKKGLVSKDSNYNNVNYNIEILDESDMPNIENGNFILAGHSGSGRLAFFKRLNELKLGDETYIYFNGIKYIYKVTNIYDIEKTGTAIVKRNYSTTTLTMITCRTNTNKQIVIISELVDKTNY